MKTHIYLIRHGEVHNPDHIFYGRLPGYGLSEKGRQEIAASAKYLATKEIEALYSSPLLRATQSMEIIRTTLGLPTILTSDKLLEVRSSFQGISFKQAHEMHYDWFFNPKRKPDDETMEQIRDRMLHFLTEIEANHQGKTIAALSHGDPLMIVKAAIQGRPMTLNSIREGYYLSHGEILQVTIDGKQMSIQSVFIPHL